MKEHKKNFILSAVVGIVLLGLLAFLAQRQSKEPVIDGPTTPDGQPFLGPTSPPPGADFSR